MDLFDRCPVCGGKVVAKKVEELVRGGGDVAGVTVTAEICLDCGERLYAPETIREFEKIKSRLRKHDISDFQPMGQFFHVGAGAI